MKKVFIVSANYSVIEAVGKTLCPGDHEVEIVHPFVLEHLLKQGKIADVILMDHVKDEDKLREEWGSEQILRKLKSQPWWGGHTRAIGISSEPQPYVSEKFLGVHRLLESGIIGEGLRAELVALVSYP